MRALLLVDIQNDFLPGGALAAPGGDRILPYIKELITSDFDVIVASKDWHPSGHGSFASTHGKEVGEVIELEGLEQRLWPDHCIQDTQGAELHPVIEEEAVDHIVFKGIDPNVDSYSAFFDNARRRSTGLSEYLKERGVDHVFIAGLVTDYCVKFTALDAVEQGFETTVLLKGCVALDVPKGEEQRAIEQMRAAGVKVL